MNTAETENRVIFAKVKEHLLAQGKPMKAVLVGMLLGIIIGCGDKISEYEIEYYDESEKDTEMEGAGGNESLPAEVEKPAIDTQEPASDDGGAELTPPYTPTCATFRCGSITYQGSSDVVYCLDVAPNNSTTGHLVDYKTDTSPGDCMVTLDGARFDSISSGLPAGRLLVWGCQFWLNCY